MDDLQKLCPKCGKPMKRKEAYWLYDYKTSGSFKVMKALGLVGKKIPDPSGEVYRKSGKWGKAGSVKMITEYKQDPAAVDMWEWEYQLNNYRIKIEATGFPVSKMKAQVTVRDGGTIVAFGRGVNENIYVIPVARLEDIVIKEYFTRKRLALLDALKYKRLPPPCNPRENWNGRRCQDYCEVWPFCDVGVAAHKKGGKGHGEERKHKGTSNGSSKGTGHITGSEEGISEPLLQNEIR